jgi:hypothetical protein
MYSKSRMFNDATVTQEKYKMQVLKALVNTLFFIKITTATIERLVDRSTCRQNEYYLEEVLLMLHRLTALP